jgi:hypothetical protein
MAQFTGFTCDDCGTVVESKDRVRKTTRFESDDPALTGEAKQDLCPECARSHLDNPELDVQPLRRRKGKDNKGEHQTPGDLIEQDLADDRRVGEVPQALPN